MTASACAGSTLSPRRSERRGRLVGAVPEAADDVRRSDVPVRRTRRAPRRRPAGSARSRAPSRPPTTATRAHGSNPGSHGSRTWTRPSPVRSMLSTTCASATPWTCSSSPRRRGAPRARAVRRPSTLSAAERSDRAPRPGPAAGSSRTRSPCAPRSACGSRSPSSVCVADGDAVEPAELDAESFELDHGARPDPRVADGRARCRQPAVQLRKRAGETSSRGARRGVSGRLIDDDVDGPSAGWRSAVERRSSAAARSQSQPDA